MSGWNLTMIYPRSMVESFCSTFFPFVCHWPMKNETRMKELVIITKDFSSPSRQLKTKEKRKKSIVSFRALPVITSDLKHSRQRGFPCFFFSSFRVRFSYSLLDMMCKHTHTHTIWLANFLNVGCHWSISYMIHVKFPLPCSLIFFSLNETKTPSQVAHKQTLVNTMESLFTFCLLFFWILTCWGIYYHFPLVSESSKKKKERKQFTTTSCYKNIRREQLAISVAPHTYFPSDSII